MSKIDILKRINKAISPNKVDFSVLDSEIQALKKKLEETVNIQTVDDVSRQLKSFQKKIDFAPILEEVKRVGEEFANKSKELRDMIASRENDLESVKRLVVNNDAVNRLKVEIKTLRESLSQLEMIQGEELKSLEESIATFKNAESKLKVDIKKISEDLNTKVTKKEVEKVSKETKEQMEELNNSINRVKEFASSNRGGNANRNIAIGGNTSVLSRYTDINIKPGSNVTLTYSNNNTSKYLDLTIAATGGAGTSRSISTVTVSSVLADTAATDIVVLANGGIKLTLPTAVANTNLYTIKNIGTSSVLVNTTGGQTIDSDPTVLMPVQYTAVDLISDNTNWHIT